MNNTFIKQVLAELIDAEQQALAVLTGALADSCGPAFAQAFLARQAAARAAAPHPMRDRLLETAAQAMQAHLKKT